MSPPPVPRRRPKTLAAFRQLAEIKVKHPIGTTVAIVIGLLALSMFGGKEPEPVPAPKPAATQSQSTLIDINRASAGDLMGLKGIGPARAEDIIKGRPYARKDELVQKKIISESVYEGIKDQIIARQK